jgi:hypothetical protein
MGFILSTGHHTRVPEGSVGILVKLLASPLRGLEKKVAAVAAFICRI